METSLKQNVLTANIEGENKSNLTRTLIGGIIIRVETSCNVSFSYCINRITDTHDLTGWNFFNPSTLNKSTD
ncbi:MAG: hypothetical protein RBR87_13975 [Bacteroidales bacterium]|jgi:hypothetical protein|nr:hypothetical protein [Bacteroidales bacterium]